MAKTDDETEDAQVQTELEHVATDLGRIYREVRERDLIRRYYDENPYVVLAGAAAIGYIVGGGLLTPFTRRMIRIGMKAMVVPVAASQLKSLKDATLN